MQRTKYPILSERKVRKFVRTLTTDGITAPIVRINKGPTALHVGLDHKGKGPLDNEGIDGLLSNLDFLYKISPELDREYGRNKYYVYEKRGTIWVALGDNAYAGDWTRILLRWSGDAFDPKEISFF